MIGKKLYHLLNELSTAERRLLFNKAKWTNDKRYPLFIRLLGTKGQKMDDFSASLVEIELALQAAELSAKAKNIALRRFTSFCIKEVEELKIARFVESDKRLRSYVLCNVYKEIEPKNIFEGYLYDLKETLKAGNDYWLNDYYLRSKSALKLSSQTDKDIQEWKAILIEQKQEVDNYLMYKTAVITDKVASLYLNDPDSVTDLGDNFLNKAEIIKMADKAGNIEVKAILLGCLAQINFEDKSKFKKYTEEAMKLVENSKEPSSVLVKRKILIVNFLHGFHFGSRVDYLYTVINEIILIDKSLKIEDKRNLFFFFLIRLLLNEKATTPASIPDDYKLYFKDEHIDWFYQFLVAFSFFTQGKYAQCKNALIEISHSKNTHITSWARLLEIATCVKLSNHSLAVNYLNNELKRHSNKQSNRFSANSTVQFLITMANHYTIRVPKKLVSSKYSQQVTPLHTILLSTVK
jgi:hypothetical protein